MNAHAALCATLLAISVFSTGPLSAATISFTTIVDTNDLVPDGIGTFNLLSEADNRGGGFIAFRATDSSGANNIGDQFVYTGSGGPLTFVADESTPVPGGVGTFTFFSSITASGSLLAILGGNQSNRGIYADTGGGLDPVVIRNVTLIPNRNVPFRNIDIPFTSSGTNIVFIGSDDLFARPQGVFANFSTGLTAIADINTPVPNGVGNFSRFQSDFAISGTNVIFVGRDATSEDGVYADFGSGLVMIADRTTLIPDGSGNTFDDFFNAVAISGSNIAFIAKATTGEFGLYADFGSGLTTIADLTTPVPGGMGTFSDFDDLSMDRDLITQNLVFGGDDATGQEGIYALFNGALIKIIALNDPLDGQIVTDLFSSGRPDGNPALAGDTVVFGATLSDNTTGLYLATISDEDSDGDGIPDDEDDCPDSNLDDTVSIDGCDSGVNNPVFSDGCTLADIIDEIMAECADGAKNHGKFVSCFAKSANDLKKDGIITGDEKGALQSCAGQSSLP